MRGLGKNRSLLGMFLDRNGISQEWIVKESGLSRNVLTRLCDGSRDSSKMQVGSKQKVISVLRKHGFDVTASDFWPL